MARSLAVVAAAGIGASVICLSLASVFSPYRELSFPYFSSRPPNESGWWRSRPWDGRMPFAESGEIVTREFSWNGGDHAEIWIPAAVYYQPGPAWRVTAKGPESSVEHLRIEAGQIFFDGSLTYPHRSSLEVRITGPALASIGLKGGGNLILENIAQVALELNLMGNGSVSGQGTVEKLELQIFGSGNADLAKLATEDIEANIFGSGNADVAPTGDVEVSIFGSGDVRLHTHPRNVSTKTFGSGRTIQLDPDKALRRKYRLVLHPARSADRWQYRGSTASGTATAERRMKFLPLIWAGLWRKKLRTILTLLSIIVAYLLFGLLQGINQATNYLLAAAHVNRLFVLSSDNVTALPIAYLGQITGVAGVSAAAVFGGFDGQYQDPKNSIHVHRHQR